jgi:hypothetical protein
MYTTEEIKNLNPKKIYSITQKVGLLGSATLLKIYIDDFQKNRFYNVVTRNGILNYFGNAQKAVIYGKKNIDFKTFKTPEAAAKFIKHQYNLKN